VGAALIALTALSPLLWAVAAVYHAALLWLLVREARRLPTGGEVTASRQLPEPLALGAEQTVLVGVSCPRAAGLRAEVADHAPLPLRASPDPVAGTFDADGFLIVEYGIRSPRRGLYEFPAIDLRIWREGGWWFRQLRLPVFGRAAVYPDVLAIRRWQLTLRRGVRVLPGGDYGFMWNPHGNNARDLAYFVDLLGFTPMQAIVGATRLGGEIMGMPESLGQVRKGFLADLLLVDGDPLSDVSIVLNPDRLVVIMKDGQIYNVEFATVPNVKDPLHGKK